MKIDSLGFKFNNIAYSSDVVDFYPESFDLLDNLDYWIVDALRYDPHPTHAHLDLTLKWIKNLIQREEYLQTFILILIIMI